MKYFYEILLKVINGILGIFRYIKFIIKFMILAIPRFSVAYPGKNFGEGSFFGRPSVQGISGGGGAAQTQKEFMKKMRKIQ